MLREMAKYSMCQMMVFPYVMVSTLFQAVIIWALGTDWQQYRADAVYWFDIANTVLTDGSYKAGFEIADKLFSPIR